jgi:hypothetical protein
MKENTHFDHKPGQRELPGYSTINDLTSTKTTPSPTNSNPLLKTGHFYFAENRTFSFCVDKRMFERVKEKFPGPVRVRFAILQFQGKGSGSDLRIDVSPSSFAIPSFLSPSGLQ